MQSFMLMHRFSCETTHRDRKIQPVYVEITWKQTHITLSDRREICILYAAIHSTGQNYFNSVFLYEYILIDEERHKSFDEIHKNLIHRTFHNKL